MYKALLTVENQCFLTLILSRSIILLSDRMFIDRSLELFRPNETFINPQVVCLYSKIFQDNFMLLYFESGFSTVIKYYLLLERVIPKN